MIVIVRLGLSTETGWPARAMPMSKRKKSSEYFFIRLPQFLDLDIPEEDRGAGMLALEADAAARGQLREGPAQPGRDLAPVGIRLGRRPTAHVHLRDTLAVEDGGDLLAETGDRVAVPLARLLDDALCRGQVPEGRSAMP